MRSITDYRRSDQTAHEVCIQCQLLRPFIVKANIEMWRSIKAMICRVIAYRQLLFEANVFNILARNLEQIGERTEVSTLEPVLKNIDSHSGRRVNGLQRTNGPFKLATSASDERLSNFFGKFTAEHICFNAHGVVLLSTFTLASLKLNAVSKRPRLKFCLYELAGVHDVVSIKCLKSYGDGLALGIAN